MERFAIKYLTKIKDETGGMALNLTPIIVKTFRKEKDMFKEIFRLYENRLALRIQFLTIIDFKTERPLVLVFNKENHQLWEDFLSKHSQ